MRNLLLSSVMHAIILGAAAMPASAQGNYDTLPATNVASPAARPAAHHQRS